MRAQLDYDLPAKMGVIGDSGVGKTNILLRFCDNAFEPNHIQTLGVELKNKVIDVEGMKIKMEIWDTSVCKWVKPSYYNGTIGFFQYTQSMIKILSIYQLLDKCNQIKYQRKCLYNIN